MFEKGSAASDNHTVLVKCSRDAGYVGVKKNVGVTECRMRGLGSVGGLHVLLRPGSLSGVAAGDFPSPGREPDLGRGDLEGGAQRQDETCSLFPAMF